MPENEGPKTQSNFSGTQVTDDGTGPKILEHSHRLLVVNGPDRGLEVEIKATKLTIGSSSSNDLVLQDTTVSRRHMTSVVDSCLGELNQQFDAILFRQIRLGQPLLAVHFRQPKESTLPQAR